MCPATPENPQCYGDMDHFDLGSLQTFEYLSYSYAGDDLVTKRYKY